MKTVLITSFHALISRNILGTELLRMFTDEGWRVVIAVPDFKRVFFERFTEENVIVEGLNPKRLSRPFFRALFFHLARTKARDIKKRAELYRNGRPIRFFFSLVPGLCLGWSHAIIALLRHIDTLLAPDDCIKDLFARYSPSLVLATDIQQDVDVQMVHYARKTHIPTAGMVRSWDNLTSKGLLRVVPDLLVVQNDVARREAMTLNGISDTRITTVGIPHYDRYLTREKTLRRDFLTRMKLHPEKPLIVYAPIGDRYIEKNGLDWLVIQTLASFDANLLVRMPPTVDVTLGAFENTCATVVFDQPGEHPWISGIPGEGRKDNEIGRDDDDRLADTLTHADVLVAGQSTIVIDAALFDTPIVTVAFDEGPRDYYDSIRRYYDYEYYAPVRRSGGVRFAESPDDLRGLVEDYLDDPALDRAGRKVIVDMFAGSLDGRATERLFLTLQKLALPRLAL